MGLNQEVSEAECTDLKLELADDSVVVNGVGELPACKRTHCVSYYRAMYVNVGFINS